MGCATLGRTPSSIKPPICYSCDKPLYLAKNYRSIIDNSIYANLAKYFDAALAVQYIDYYQHNPWYTVHGLQSH